MKKIVKQTANLLEEEEKSTPVESVVIAENSK